MADVSVSMEEKDPPYDAVRQCCVYVLQMFPPDAVRDWRSGARDTLLHLAVIYDCPEAIPVLAPHVDVNAHNAYGETALDTAARIGDVEAVRLLLEAGADPAVVNKYGDTPLHTAVLHRHADVVKLFLSRGVDPNIRDRHGETPLHDAALIGDGAVVKTLIDAGADVNARDDRGRRPPHYVSAFSHVVNS
jgi:cytohesin